MWCRLRDLNPQPPDYKSGALPVELSRNYYKLCSMEAFFKQLVNSYSQYR